MSIFLRYRFMNKLNQIKIHITVTNLKKFGKSTLHIILDLVLPSKELPPKQMPDMMCQWHEIILQGRLWDPVGYLHKKFCRYRRE